MTRPNSVRSWLSTSCALAITVGLSVFLNFVGVRSYVLLSQYSGFADHFNTVGVIFLLFLLTMVGLLVRCLIPSLSPSPASMALVYAALMVSTVIPTMGFGGY
ncbi:MAG: hypothetical protein HOH74_00405, partial [Gemmatimonadetes bacterium]|nr:hypothetical protein [Gemmatimonadota bacterium]